MAEFIKERVVPAVCGLLPHKLWGRITGVNPAIAYYHLVSDEEVPHVRHLYGFRTIEQFKKDIETFCRFFQPIGLDDLLATLTAGRAPAPNSFLLTFDDGFREIYDVIAPILREKGVPATFFLTTACLDNKTMAHHNKISLLIEQANREPGRVTSNELWRLLSERGIQGRDVRAALFRLDYREGELVERLAEVLNVNFKTYLSRARPYLSSPQVQDLLRMGFTIGGHSVDHPLYATLSLDEQVYQTRASVQFLRQRFSLNYGAFAFPHGHNNVSGQFFRQLFSEPGVDVCFGTAGILESPVPRHFHRFSLENSSARAETILARFYARNLYKRWLSPRGNGAVGSSKS